MKLQYLFASLLDVTVLKQATEKIFKAMSQRDRMIEQIYDFIHGSESDEMYCVMVELVNRLDDNIDAEERSEDATRKGRCNARCCKIQNQKVFF